MYLQIAWKILLISILTLLRSFPFFSDQNIFLRQVLGIEVLLKFEYWCGNLEPFAHLTKPYGLLVEVHNAHQSLQELVFTLFINPCVITQKQTFKNWIQEGRLSSSAILFIPYRCTNLYLQYLSYEFILSSSWTAKRVRLCPPSTPPTVPSGSSQRPSFSTGKHGSKFWQSLIFWRLKGGGWGGQGQGGCKNSPRRIFFISFLTFPFVYYPTLT